MSGEDVVIKGADGSFGGYLAKPAAGKGPGLVVIQEIFGVNQVMREICDMYASQGFFALCPDLFWRQEPGIQLTDQTKEGWDRAFQLYQGFDVDAGIKDIAATIDFLRHVEGCSGKVGAVGYCLGGLLAFLTICRTDADAAVGYYGVGIETRLDEARNISKPLMLHVAQKDQFVPPEAQRKLHEALDNHPRVTIHDYPDQDHAFARMGGEHYDRQAAETANRRTIEFFKQNLAFETAMA